METITFVVDGKEYTFQVDSSDEMYNEIEKQFGFKVADEFMKKVEDVPTHPLS